MDPVDHVRAALEEAGLDPGLVRELPADTSTAEAAAEAVGAPTGSIVKSLIFLAEGTPLLVLVAGDQRADVKRLRAQLGLSKRQLRIARPTEVRELTGFEVGGVPPVGHATPPRTLIDASLGREKRLLPDGPHSQSPSREFQAPEEHGIDHHDAYHRGNSEG